LLGYLLRRLVWAAAVVFFTAVLAYGGIRALRPELFEGQPLLAGLRGDLERVFLHFELGCAGFQIGCPPLNEIILRNLQADVLMLAGTFLLGTAGGIAGGAWCAARPGTRSARALESAATVAFCMPVYVLGLGLLLLFAPPFGLVEMPLLFDLHTYVSPFESPVVFLGAMLVPWAVAAAPLAAGCLRLTLGLIRDAEHEDFVRTAAAKGLSHRQVIRRHAGRATRVPVAAYVGVSVPWVVTNAVLVEIVFNVPGNFRFIRKAVIGFEPPGPVPDYPSLQAFAVYTAIFIVLATLIADYAVAALDPRTRSPSRAT
jgi:peptide/nickel transport system permease protein